MPKHLPSAGGADEPSDLEELEKFAKTFKQRRIKLGFTQVWFGTEEVEELGLEELDFLSVLLRATQAHGVWGKPTVPCVP